MWTVEGSLRTILYARVSSVDQTIAHQEAQARAAGFKIDEVVADDGVSGVRVSGSARRVAGVARADQA